ncbi:fatty acid--CoA ligase family protein [Streptomyces diacarni]|uniref:Fatty acid--CoA ligase family protein n=1 Tax=Streptomyces diacarni TaxID=2800381 RepID=A0A367ER04_9ACTN|nr:AMP-binding protein [Streptomyces diacarni]RCG19620.1 fatty acid--CoA ligase family protein [Streptomyces diacarni]
MTARADRPVRPARPAHPTHPVPPAHPVSAGLPEAAAPQGPAPQGPGGTRPPATLAELTAFAAGAYPEREALVEYPDDEGAGREGGEVRWSFATLRAHVVRSAKAALAHGVRKGDRVAVWAPNSRHWITAALGAVSVGAVLVPLNTRYKPAEAADILRRSRARFLFTVGSFLGTDYARSLTDSGEPLPDLESTVTLPTCESAPPGGGAEWPALPYAAFLDRAVGVGDREYAARAAAVTPDDLCDILYTSGTTGRPKGVEITHGQTLEAFTEWARAVGLRAGDRYLLLNPFFHTFGYKAGVLACLLTGTTMVPEAVYDAGRALRRVAGERVSVLMGPPTIFHTLIDHPDRLTSDLSSLRLAGTGAAGVPVDLVARIRRELGAAEVFTAYGLSESAGVATVCPTSADAATVAGTVGLPLPGTQVRIVTADGTEAAPGEPGEIRLRARHVMRGYCDDPEATAAALDAEGWLRTGDVGRLDERGYLTLTDRLKDMYIVGGFNTYPAEIEHALRGHPDVADAAVIGVPDARLGEVGAAYVVPRAGADAAALEGCLADWARARLANYKLPRTVTAVTALPRNASGKVLKNVLRARHAPTGAAGQER